MRTRVTNQELYNERVIDLDFNNVHNVTESSFTGNLAIEVEGEGWREYDGQHGFSDYEKEFGFVIEK